jgi:four helix bundle protein
MSHQTPVNLQTRTKQFALRIIRLFSALPNGTVAQTLGKQLLRSGTSVGANYREACRARSSAEFVSKLEISLQELAETEYWLELLAESGIVGADRLKELFAETKELTAILVASARTAKGNKLRDEGDTYTFSLQEEGNG